MSAPANVPCCPICGGERIQYEDGPDDTLQCAWCWAEPGQVATVDPAVYPELVE